METQNIEDFKSGRTEKGTGYRFFMPNPINKQWAWTSNQLNTLLEKASMRLGELNAFARLVPSMDQFIHLHVTKEAVISSRIEGTQTNMNEALLPKEAILPGRKDDWQEVRNYTDALNSAIAELDTLPLSSRLIRNTHQILMQGVRGEHKKPGEFRTSQNWIGGATLSDAVFVPPPHTHVPELMADLEKFLHNDDIEVPALIRIGIAHYQFETIHPFLDGNGRIGRLLITLYLVDQKMMDKPLLYLSAFFEKNKSVYYDNLSRTRENNDLLHWLVYFLVGVEQTASQAAKTLSKVLEIKEELENGIRKKYGRKTHYALMLFYHLFREPVISIKQVEKTCRLSKKSANDLVDAFHADGILHEITGQQRYKIYVFNTYLDLFK